MSDLPLDSGAAGVIKISINSFGVVSFPDNPSATVIYHSSYTKGCGCRVVQSTRMDNDEPAILCQPCRPDHVESMQGFIDFLLHDAEGSERRLSDVIQERFEIWTMEGGIN